MLAFAPAARMLASTAPRRRRLSLPVAPEARALADGHGLILDSQLCIPRRAAPPPRLLPTSVLSFAVAASTSEAAAAAAAAAARPAPDTSRPPARAHGTRLCFSRSLNAEPPRPRRGA
jgi:pyruvate/2-oxoglutarate dehydrogenase complex dihydrolipoamide acyltransferase (E2) component